MATAALFLFLAAAIVAVFAFASIVVWVSGPARERQERDRLALLKTLAENPSPQAGDVLDWIRDQEAIRALRREREQRRNWIVSGEILIAVAVGLALMLAVMGDVDTWKVGVAAGSIPFLVGCVLLATGLTGNDRRSQTPR